MKENDIFSKDQEKVENVLSLEKDFETRLKLLIARQSYLKGLQTATKGYIFAGAGSVLSSLPLTVIDKLPQWGTVAMSLGGLYAYFGSSFVSSKVKRSQETTCELLNKEMEQSKNTSKNQHF